MSGDLSAHDERFAVLAFRQFEGLATPAERMELAAVLKQDAAQLARFAQLARQHGLLGELLAVPAPPMVAVPTISEPTIGGATQVLRRSSRRVRVFRRRPASSMGWIATAAALLVLVIGGVIATRDGRAVVGRLESSVTVRAPGSPVYAGDRVDGSRGEYVVLRDGSRIGLTAGTSITVAGADRIVLTTGMVLVEATPRSSAALVIETPQAEAKVLGTRFTVVAVDGRTQLDVAEGLVRFRRRSDGATLDVPAAAWAEVAIGRPFVIHQRSQAVVTSPPERFVLGVNLNGGPVTIDGDRWWSQREAVDHGLVVPGDAMVTATAVTPMPAVEGAVATMLNTAIHRVDTDLPLSLPLADGPYVVDLWLMENYRPGHRSLTITIEGTVVAQRVQDGDAVGVWHRLTYPATISDGRLDLVLGGPGQQPHLMGLSVKRR